jgi:hypothetical protein
MLLLMLLLAADPYQAADIPATTASQVTHAAQAMLAGDLSGAADELERVVKSYPEYFLAHYHLGVVYEKMDRLGESAQELQRAKELNDRLHLGEASVNASLGWVRFRTHDYSSARAETMKSVLSPNFFRLDTLTRRQVFNNLGTIYTSLRRPCQAQLYNEIGSRELQVPPNGGSSGLLGGWIVVSWAQPADIGLRIQSETKLEGVLRIESGSANTLSEGTLTLCLGPHGTDRVVEELHISQVGSHLDMTGTVIEGANRWSNDRIRAGFDGVRIRGTVDHAGDTMVFLKVL